MAAGFAEPPGNGCRAAMRHQDLFGPGRRDGREQLVPIRVIRYRKPPIERLAAPGAPYQHPALHE